MLPTPAMNRKPVRSSLRNFMASHIGIPVMLWHDEGILTFCGHTFAGHVPSELIHVSARHSHKSVEKRRHTYAVNTSGSEVATETIGASRRMRTCTAPSALASRQPTLNLAT